MASNNVDDNLDKSVQHVKKAKWFLIDPAVNRTIKSISKNSNGKKTQWTYILNALYCDRYNSL